MEGQSARMHLGDEQMIAVGVVGAVAQRVLGLHQISGVVVLVAEDGDHALRVVGVRSVDSDDPTLVVGVDMKASTDAIDHRLECASFVA